MRALLLLALAAPAVGQFTPVCSPVTLAPRTEHVFEALTYTVGRDGAGMPAIQFVVDMSANPMGYGAVGFRAAGSAGPAMAGIDLMAFDWAGNDVVDALSTTTQQPTIKSTTRSVMVSTGGVSTGGYRLTFFRPFAGGGSTGDFDVPMDGAAMQLVTAIGRDVSFVRDGSWSGHASRMSLDNFTVDVCPGMTGGVASTSSSAGVPTTVGNSTSAALTATGVGSNATVSATGVGSNATVSATGVGSNATVSATGVGSNATVSATGVASATNGSGVSGVTNATGATSTTGGAAPAEESSSWATGVSGSMAATGSVAATATGSAAVSVSAASVSGSKTAGATSTGAASKATGTGLAASSSATGVSGSKTTGSMSVANPTSATDASSAAVSATGASATGVRGTSVAMSMSATDVAGASAATAGSASGAGGASATDAVPTGSAGSPSATGAATNSSATHSAVDTDAGPDEGASEGTSWLVWVGVALGVCAVAGVVVAVARSRKHDGSMQLEEFLVRSLLCREEPCAEMDIEKDLASPSPLASSTAYTAQSNPSTSLRV
eukprot:TRINITY_DN729_c0_g2_i9.p1 TRINITY_DN729_c0_g2~~TRINITY_DN729_c0_g2_i9.p1  ORF type:complete len:553 (+),score=61.83 TRINITY_DN729_c0_g2_i9:85-1743(+)